MWFTHRMRHAILQSYKDDISLSAEFFSELQYFTSAGNLHQWVARQDKLNEDCG